MAGAGRFLVEVTVRSFPSASAFGAAYLAPDRRGRPLIDFGDVVVRSKLYRQIFFTFTDSNFDSPSIPSEDSCAECTAPVR